MGQSPPSPVLHDRASPFNIVDRSTSQWSSFSFPDTGSPPDVILNKLSFKDRQISRGTIIVPYRLLCKQANESRNHTFFDCHFVKEKWIDVLSTSTLEDVIKSFGGLNKSDWIVLSFQVVCPAFIFLGWNKNAVLIIISGVLQAVSSCLSEINSIIFLCARLLLDSFFCSRLAIVRVYFDSRLL
ncbi:hypothetical protein NC652_002515 [Populus alba x Populus x berolinensis]|nr:hypothetical protein NC652_002515 [Populus alba x Populus x berolinensis]